MANIQINSSPPAIALIGEGLTYEIERTSGGITGYALLILDFPENQSYYLDKYFEITTKAGDIRFYFRANPDESGLELTSWVSGDSFTTFIAGAVTQISHNYLINSYYIVEQTTIGIKFKARETGTSYNITFDNITSIISLDADTTTPGIDDITPSDYQIYVGVCVYADYIEIKHLPIGEDLYNTNDENKVYPDVSEYLKSLLSSSFTFPFNGIITRQVPNSVLYYFIRYAEYEDGNVLELYNTYSTPKLVIAGKLKQIDSDFLNNENTSYFNYMDFDKRFLTWSPKTKITYPNTAERLFFLVTKSLLKLMCRKYFTDGTISNEITLYEFPENVVDIFEIACGTSELFVGENISLIEKYEVWIENDKNEAESEVRTFIINHKTFLNTRTIIFQNSFNMYDMQHCTGILTINDNVKREEVEILTNNAFRRKVQLAENTATYTLNSGWLANKEARLWLEELQLSKEVYLALGDFILPVIMKTGKIERSKDREDNYSIKIVFEPDFKNEAYSAIVGEGAYFYADENMVIYTDENGTKLIE